VKANTANILTFFRLLAVPLFCWTFFKAQYGAAFTLFLFAGISDLVDGYIARRFNQRTKLGAMLDPIADKLLMVSTFLGLATIAIVPWWFVVVMVGKDLLIITGIGLLKLTKTPFQYRAAFWSKATTLCLIVLGTLALLDLVFPNVTIGVYPVADFVFGGIFVTAGLMVITTLIYLQRGLDLASRRRAPQ
jgi:cardiolipin synthase (CMP-forming)